MALPPIHHALHLSHLSFGRTVHQGCMYSLIPGQDTWAILGCRGDVEKYYPFLFCSSPPRCTVFRRQRDLYRLDIARAKKWNFCPPPSDGIFLSGERGWITLAFRGFPSSSKLFFHGPCAFLGSSRLSGLWVFMASEFRYDKEFGVWIMLYITLWIIVIAIYREDKFIK